MNSSYSWTSESILDFFTLLVLSCVILNFFQMFGAMSHVETLLYSMGVSAHSSALIPLALLLASFFSLLVYLGIFLGTVMPSMVMVGGV